MECRWKDYDKRKELDNNETWNGWHMRNWNTDTRRVTEEMCRTGILHGRIVSWFLTYISRIINMNMSSHYIS